MLMPQADLQTRVAELERRLRAHDAPLNTAMLKPKIPSIDLERLWINRTSAEAQAAGVGHVVQRIDGLYVPAPAR